MKKVKMKVLRIDLTINEFLYLLFARKSCPRCGRKMTKHENYEILDGETFANDSTPTYIVGRNVNHILYTFSYAGCKKEFTLKELAIKNRRL